MDNERPHSLHDKIEAWEHRADSELELNRLAIGADGLGLTSEELKHLVWNGLQASVEAGYREPFECEQIYFNWFKELPSEQA